MKRINFIRNISLVGAGIALAPTQLVFGKTSGTNYQLPKPTIHILHGNFDSAIKEAIPIRELNIQCSVERFMRNGIQACSNDLQVITFTRGSETIIACFGENESQISGGINGLSFSNSNYRIQIESIDSILKYQKDSNSFSVSRKG